MLIGNVASNSIQGGDGDDRVFGDGKAFGANRDWSEWWSLSETTNDKEEWIYDGIDQNGANPSKTQHDDLNGGAGDDEIFGGAGYNTLRGGTGDDDLYAAGRRSTLYGGSGADTFTIGANTIVADAEMTGDSIWMGLPIFGGTKQWWMEGNKAYWSPFSTIMTALPVIGSEILATAAVFIDVFAMKFASFQSQSDGSLDINIGYGLGGKASIENYQLNLDTGAASGGVVVFEASRRDGTASSGHKEPNKENFIQFINLALKAGFGVGFGRWDPIVLDLDGDGYELTTQRNSGVHFEFDGDGFAEKTGWVRPDDGFLVLDANNNGIVDDSSEFFGDETQGGFTELATHDLNADGVIDANDAVFTQLQVWRDLNGDGVTDNGELVTLTDLGIVSISVLGAAPAEAIDIGGNTIAAEAAFTFADGTTGMAGDVLLDISHIDTKYITTTTVSAAAAALPELRGFGNVADLSMAMSEDAALLAQVQAFDQLATSDLAVLKQAAEDILYAWAGVDTIATDAIGANGFDARKLAFLEAFSGQEIAPRDPVTGEVSTAGLTELEASWADTLENLTLRLVIQSSVLPVFADMTYREDIDVIVMGSADALKQAYSTILSGLSSDPVVAQAEWEAWSDLLRAVQDGSRRFDNNIVRNDFAAAQLQAAVLETGTGLNLADLAPALGIFNLQMGTSTPESLGQVDGGTIFSGLGDGDTAVGRGGQDVYLLESGFGNVTIDDEEAKKSGDRVRFVDLNRADVSAARVGDDLVLTVTASGDTVTVLGQFADVVPLSSDVIISNNRGVEEIQFADGAIMELPDIAIAVGEGTSSDDVMHGTMHTDVFQGRAGNDLLMGGDDADLYVFDAGDGADIIRDVQTTVLLKAADMIILGDDIAPEDVVFSRGADANDFIITIGDNGDSITVDDQFAYSSLGYNAQFAPNSRIEVLSYRHYGDVYTNKDIQQQLIASETTDGDDITRGFGDDDVFRSSAGDDTFIGLDGADTYFFRRGFGNDTIDEQAYYIDVNVGLGGLSLEHGADTVVFAPDIDPADVVFTRLSEAPDLTVELDSGETLTIKNQFNGFQTGSLGEQWFDRIEWFEFGDGTRLSWQDVLLDVTTGTDGDDSLWGDLYQDTLTGGLGNDYLSGGGYADTYIFNLGDGQDVIDDDNPFVLGEGFVTIDTTPDILRFGAGITAADIAITRDGNGLTLAVGTGGDAVTLKGQNDYYDTGVFGAISDSRVERIEFAGGGVWTWQELNQRAIADQTTAGDDTITGFALEDRFEASAGNDIMRGGDSSDTYVFGFGSGQDRIEESISNQNFEDDDRVEFEAGIAANDVTYSRNGDDLIINLSGTSDQLTIAGQFENYVWITDRDVEFFDFADGTTVTKADIQQHLTVGTSSDDVIHGFHTSDTLIGGLGNDSLYGGDGSDRYEFNLGDGQDTIFETVEYANLDDEDYLVFGAGILPSDISLSRNGDALTLSINGTSDSVTIDGQFSFASWFSWHDVEFFEFADGTVWTKGDVSTFLTGGTAGDDVIIGTFQTDEINGGAGNDTLRGEDGADIYYFDIGHGQDRIEETRTNANLSNYDQIVFGEGIAASDLTFTRNGENLTIGYVNAADTILIAGQFDNYINYTDRDIERLQFADGSVMTKEDIQSQLTIGTSGDDEVVGFHTHDYIDGGAGNDILRGLDGSDTYFFGRGSGNDIIRESVQYVNIDDDDRIEFATDLTPSDIVWSRSGTTLIIGIVDTNDTLTIEGGLDKEGSTSYTWRDIEFFDFSEGTTLTKADVQNILLTPTDGDDTIDGFWTSDVLAGGLGNDLLRGGQGSDGYIYSLGDGDDIISDYYDYWGNSGDYIEFDATIAVADVTVDAVATDRNDLRLNVAGGGSITIDNQLTGSREWTIDQVRFSDGTTWDKEFLLSRLISDQISGIADTIYGSPNDELILSLAGDDTVFAGGGSDTIEGGEGSDTLHGEAGSDSINGGLDADILHGGAGNDTFHYFNGQGSDEIIEIAGEGSADTLRLHGIERSRVTFETYAASNDIALVIANSTAGAGDGARIEIRGTYDTQSDSGIELIEFDDGTILTKSDVTQVALTPDVDDTIVGTNSGESFVGGRGDDTITGNRGNDVFYYARGDGNDTYNEWRYHDWDRVVLSNIAPSDVSLVRNGKNVTLVISESAPGAGDGGEIYLNGGSHGSLVNSRETGFERIDFDDGTQWTPATMRAMLLEDASTTGDDTINGFDNSDVFEGGTGNDTITGGAGNDTYIYNRGDGDDQFNEWRYGDYDVVSLRGVDPSDVGLEQNGKQVTLVIAESAPGAGDGGRIFLNGGSYGAIENSRETGFERIDFDDGTQWTPATMRADLIAAQTTNGNDEIFGFINGDVFEGGLGDDIIRGSDGNDRYIYSRGDGNDTYGDYRYQETDTVEFTDILPYEVIFYSSGATVYAKILDTVDGAGDGSLLTFWESTSTGSTGIDRIEYADGTAQSDDTFLSLRYTVGTVAADTLSGTTGNDRLFGDYGDDVLAGGAGNDVLNGSYGMDLADYSGLSTEYTIITSGGMFQLQDDVTATGDDEGTDTLIGIEALRFGDGATVGIASPIILDLDGNGIDTVSASVSDARFDLNGDGVADDTSWIGGGDAFLYLDRDGNGTVSSAKEISFIDDAPNAASDLAGLTAFDSNADGILDADDARFDEFGVWRDADSDGVADAGETSSLSDIGISSINLGGTAVDGATSFGEVAIANTGSFSFSDGTTHSFADAALTYFAAEPASSIGYADDLNLQSTLDGFEFGRAFWWHPSQGGERWNESHAFEPEVPALDRVFEMLRRQADARDVFALVGAGSDEGDKLAKRAVDTPSVIEDRPRMPAWTNDPASPFFMMAWPESLDLQNPSLRFDRFESLVLRAEPQKSPVAPEEKDDSPKRAHVMPNTRIEIADTEDAEKVASIAISRKLELIRQDIASFGAMPQDESLGPQAKPLEVIEFYA